MKRKLSSIYKTGALLSAPTFASYTCAAVRVSCPHQLGIIQNGLFSFAATQITKKNNAVTQNAATTFRVAIKMTVKKMIGRTHEP